MLDLPFLVKAKHVKRRATLSGQLLSQVRKALENRRIKDSDSERFLQDLDNFLLEQPTREGSTRFDSHCLGRATGF